MTGPLVSVMMSRTEETVSGGKGLLWGRLREGSRESRLLMISPTWKVSSLQQRPGLYVSVFIYVY